MASGTWYSSAHENTVCDFEPLRHPRLGVNMGGHPPLPLQQGVGASRVFLPAGPWPTVLAFLSERFPHVPLMEWCERCAGSQVLFASGEMVTVHTPYQPLQTVFYYRSLPQETVLPETPRVLFEDEHVLVADKPHFMPVTPGGRYIQNSLLVQMRMASGCETLAPIHRIDRETAGVVVFCKRPQDRDAYHGVFRQQQAHKVYLAVAAFKPELTLPVVHRSRLVAGQSFFLSQEVAGEPNSETRVSLLKRWQDKGLYELHPITGRRHQLRIHMLSLGLPIEGDQFYPKVLRGPDEADDFSVCLQLLAHRLHFKDPVTGQTRNWCSQRSLNIGL